MKKLVFLAIVSFALCAPVWAWNDVGHKLSAYVAWQRLSPEVRDKLVAILAKAPEDSGLSTLYPQDSRSKAAKNREFFMIASTWADIIRDRNFPIRNKYHRSNWHYSDTFWKLENGSVMILPNPNEDGGKALEQLAWSIDVLKNPSAPDSEKAIALAWFLHLAGDIHQPLHTSARVTELEAKGDQGGNLFSLTPKDTPRESQMNLHWFWDSIVDRVVLRSDDAADSHYLPPIADKWMKKFPFARYGTSLGAGDFKRWQKESFDVATSSVFPSTLKRDQMPANDYVKSAFRISEERITLAGYRMAETLSMVFAASPSTANQPPCRIIRRVPYPVTMTASEIKGNEIALLDLCPPDKGMVQRPMTGLMINGEIKMFEYSVIRTFKNEREAREFANANGIKELSF